MAVESGNTSHACCAQALHHDLLQAQARLFNSRRGLLQSNPWFYTTSATCEGKTSSTKSVVGCATCSAEDVSKP